MTVLLSQPTVAKPKPRVSQADSAGFTLIEMMVTVTIMAILAGIAIPSYRHYVLKNHQEKVKSIMLSQAIALERWRTKQLNFAGFTPESIALDDDNITFRYPSDTTPTEYTMQLVTINGSNAAVALSSNSIATNWVIFATPRTGSGMPYIALTSQGTRCQSIDATITPVTVFSTNGCGTGSTAW